MKPDPRLCFKNENAENCHGFNSAVMETTRGTYCCSFRLCGDMKLSAVQKAVRIAVVTVELPNVCVVATSEPYLTFYHISQTDIG